MNAPSSAVEILRELVAIATPSSASNLPLLAWVAHYLEARGWQVELHPYEDERGVQKANLIARRAEFNASKSIDLAFICHTDTVPYAASWKSALTLEERAGYLHGCGACDVKGALACFLAAASESLPVDASNVALILTADEEIGCKGMDRLLASTELHIGSAIVSEPTSLRAGIAGKGYGLARISVEGIEAHSAFPQQGLSAISIAALLITSIENHFSVEVRQSPKHSAGHALGNTLESKTDSQCDAALFDPPRTTINIGLIEGGTAKNIIPGCCSFLVEWRALPEEDAIAVFQQLQSLADEAQLTDARARMDIQSLRAETGFSPRSSGPLQQRLNGLLPLPPMGISFGSEASRVARIAKEVIVIGPGDMQTAHSDRECVPMGELETWTKVLHHLMSCTT